MAKLTMEGPAEEVGLFWTQFFSRPVGFGFFNTFYPEPPGLEGEKSHRWRKTHWGVSDDVHIQAMMNNKDAEGIDLRNLEGASVLNRIAGLFPQSKFSWSITDIVPVTGLLRKPTQRPDIFDMRWHRCRYCSAPLSRHAKLQCLFAATIFTPVLPIWRTVFGEYEWQPSSMSFVNTVGSTTTTTTIKARTTDQSLAKPTSPKKKQRRTA